MICKHQECSSPMSQIARGTEFCKVVPNICTSSIWNLYHVTFLAPCIMSPSWHLVCWYVQVVQMVTRQSVHKVIIIRTMQLSVYQNIFFQCFSFFVVSDSAFVRGIDFIYCKEIFTVKMNHTINMTLRTAFQSWNKVHLTKQ